MAIFPLFKAKPFFSAAEQEQIVEAIRRAEQQTSGEVRVFVESKNPMVDPVDRAREIFFKLKMEKTQHRNGVLLYVAHKHKELALFGDEGIYTVTGKEYWQAAVEKIIENFNHQHFLTGITACIEDIGNTLKEKFPYEKATDKNELPDNIVFGK